MDAPRFACAIAFVAASFAVPAAATAQTSPTDPNGPGTSEGTSGAGALAPPAPAPSTPSTAPRADGELPPPPPTSTAVPPAYAPYPGETGASEGKVYSARTDGAFGISPEMASRLRILDADLNSVAARSGNRIMGGVLSMVSGAITISVGVLVDTSTDSDEFLPLYLYVFGGTTVARGLIELTVKPDYREPALTYSHMPMRTAEEAEARLAYGEHALEDLSDRSRLARLLDGSLALGAGAAIIPIYLAPRDFEVDTFGVFIILGASVSIVSGLVTLLLPSDAEDRWSAYEDLNKRLKAAEQTSERSVPEQSARDSSDFLRLRAFAAPLRHGFGFGLAAEF
jgi:hypothetical protein